MRTWGIEWGLPNEFHPLRTLHPDEALYVGTVAKLDPGKLQFDPGFYNHPNFFVYEIAGWLGVGKLLGAVELVPGLAYYAEHPEASADLYRWVRLGTALLGTATVLLAFLVGRELYGRKAGLWAAALFSVLPVAVVDAHYVKTDTPQLFWLAGSLAAAARFLRQGGFGWLLGSAAAAALAASNKYSAGIGIVIPLAALWLGKAEPGRLRRASALCALAAGVFVLANPFTVLSFFREAGHDVRFIFAATLDAKTLFLESSFAGKPPGWIGVWADGFWYGAGPLFEAAIVGGLIFCARRRQSADRLLLIAWLVFYVCIGYAEVQFVRFWLPCAFFSCIMVGGWLSAWIDGEHRGLLAWCAGGAVLAYSAAYSAAFDGLLARTDNRILASRWMQENIPPGTPVARLRHPEYAGAGRDFPLPPIVYVTEKEMALGLRKPYPLAWMPLDPVALTAPDRALYVVASNYETRDYARLADRYPQEAAFVAELARGVGYRLVACFGGGPHLGPLRIFPAASPPHDWLYAWPEIWIYRRRDP